MIDLRSDTVTRPCDSMRQAMAYAEVNDDVIDADPTVARLQQMIAELLGKEAALFVPSGTMANQMAVRLHCQPGDELLCEADSHLFKYEQGGCVQLSNVVPHIVKGERSILRREQLEGLISPDNEHAVRTRLVWLENTHNRGGGVILPWEETKDICRWAHSHQLATHLDGARLFNAVVASEISAADWARSFDTVSVCFSKGLGAPVGSALVGSQDMVEEMRRHRKVLGGGMRQSGIIAAGALYALEHKIARLADDHAAAQCLAEAIQQSPGLSLEPENVDTNIVIFRVHSDSTDAASFCQQLHDRGVWVFPFSQYHVRAVTHMDVTTEDCQQAGQIIRQLAEELG